MRESKKVPFQAILTMLFSSFLCVPLHAQGPSVRQEAGVKVDFAMAQKEIIAFEMVLNKVIASSFSASSFALTNRPKGVYLPGHGEVFTFLINVHRAVVDTPFGKIRQANVAPEVKKRLIEDLKVKLIRSLLDNSSLFTQLRKEDAVTVVAFMEDQNFPDEPSQNKTIVLSALRRDLDEITLRKDDDKLNEFIQRMKIIEY